MTGVINTLLKKQEFKFRTKWDLGFYYFTWDISLRILHAAKW